MLEVKKRESLTPQSGEPVDEAGVHAMRRAGGGARREVSARVFLHGKDGELHEGWALNVSRGGVRVILEGTVVLGDEYDVVVGDPDQGGTAAKGQIVWVQQEPDGIIAGVEFKGMSGEHAPPAPTDKLSEKPPTK